MVKSIDIARGFQAVEADRIRQLVRQHEVLQKQKSLPGAGLLGVLAGWTAMCLLNKDRR